MTAKGLGARGAFGAFALATIALPIVLAACGRTQVVEAPMTAADAGTGVALAAPADAGRAHAPSSDLPFDRGDRFTGYYYCAQGRTELALVIEDVDGDDVDAIFEFTFTGNGRYDPAEGSYRMRGSYEPGSRTLRLDGESWIDQPSGYQMINLVGKITPARTISGNLSGAPGCTTFSVTPTRVPGQRPKAEPRKP